MSASGAGDVLVDVDVAAAAAHARAAVPEPVPGAQAVGGGGLRAAAHRPQARAPQATRALQQVAHVERGQPGVPARLRRQGHAGVRKELPD